MKNSLTQFRTIRGVPWHLYDNGNAALAEIITPGVAFRLLEVRVHLDGNGDGGNLVITLDSAKGPAHDVVISTTPMAGVLDLVLVLGRVFAVGDILVLTWDNPSARAYGLEVIGQSL